MLVRALRIFALCAVATSQSVAAQSVGDQRAVDAFQLFKSFCLETDGSRDRALAVMGAGNALATRLPEDVVSKLQGKAGGVAWAIRSPNNATLLLAYNPDGVCEVRIAEAEEGAVVAEYATLKASLSASGQDRNTEPRAEGGRKTTFRSYQFERSGKRALVALTTSDKRIGEEQHLITFGFTR